MKCPPMRGVHSRVAPVRFRAVARALIGGGGGEGVYIHIFVLCPTNFF